MRSTRYAQHSLSSTAEETGFRNWYRKVRAKPYVGLAPDFGVAYLA
jgi:hypothetical protein